MRNPFLDPKFCHQNLNRQELRRKIIGWYYNSSIKDYHRLLRDTKEEQWQRLGQQKALNLFYQTAEHVPAYQDFLKKNGIKPQAIKTFEDFQQVPITDKANYILQYPLEKLCWHGRIENSNIISFSSGSTGKPYLWPRGIYQDYEGAFAFEHLLVSLFQIDQKSTLFVNCFSMGNYVAGVYVYTSTKLLSQKKYPLTVVSPGINYQDIYNMLTRLDSKYEQVILAGYPPFIRDVIELGNKEKYDFGKLNIKFFFASEFFSEDWRDHTLAKAGNYTPLTDSTNIYGTADSAIFSFETPVAIMIRRLIKNRPEINQSLFNSTLIPTLTQYNPLLTFYESVDHELTLTASTGVPLIRYNLKDHGGILSNHEIETTLNGYDLSLASELKKAKLTSTRSQLPFVYLTNRTDGAVSFYAIKIFPQYVRSGIEAERLHPYLSGKFSLASCHNNKQTPQLNVHVEMNAGIKPNKELEEEVFKEVFNSLSTYCAEFSFLENSIGKRAYPNIVLHEKGTSEFFETGIKQKWVNP